MTDMEYKRKNPFHKLILTMAQIGSIGFGGGSALIPVMHRKLLEEEQLVPEDAFNKDVSVAMLTPGALPVEISAGAGFRVCGIPGFFCAPAAIALPGVILSLCLCAAFSAVPKTLLNQFGFLAMAVTPYIAAVVIRYVLCTVRDVAQPLKVRQESDAAPHNFTVFIRQIFFCSVHLIVCAGICMLCLRDGGRYIWYGSLSSISSFGGGDAYLAIAEELFVATGLLAVAEYYSVIIPVVNAVPGSILCKTLSCIGFFIGLNTTGRMGTGLLIAFCGFICSVAMSCATYAAGSFFMESLERIRFYGVIKKLMRVVISALQIKVLWKLISTFLKRGTDANLPLWGTALLLAGMTAANLYLPRKAKIKPVWVVLASAVVCVVSGNMGMYFFD